jgi:hypothetical protein
MVLIIDKEELFEYVYNAIHSEGYIIHESVLEALIEHSITYIAKSIESQFE